MSHNIVTSRNGLGNGLTLFNQILRVIQPYIGAMGITGNTHYLAKFFRLNIINHLAHEGSATFRNAIGTYCATNLIWINPQGGRVLKDAHGLLIPNRNQLGIKVRVNLFLHIFFQHLQHHGIIVTQNIQLNQTVVNAVIIIMGSDGGLIGLIRRVIHRRDIVNIHITRHYHDATRMLARSALDAGQAFH